ncbi:hypothetical protein ABE10_00770, partial [Bacillus toyonensis]|nr:hypothetical protein [Bacillus toyonensis]
RIAPPRDRRDDDPPGRGGRDLVGAMPSASGHDGVELDRRAVHREVDRVAEQPLGRAGAPEEVVRHVEVGEHPVQPWQD